MISKDNNQLTKIGSFLIKLFQYLFLILTFITLISGISLIKSKIIFAIILLILLLFMLYIFKKLPYFQHFSFLIFGITFVLGLLTITILKTPIESDFHVQYLAAQALYHHHFVFDHNSYFQRWPYQIGQAIFESFLLHFFNSAFFLKLCNVIEIAGITTLLYQITRLFTSEKVARWTALLYSIFLTPLTYSAVLTNNIPGAFLALASLFCFIKAEQLQEKKYHYYYLVSAAIILSLSNFIRPDAIIYLVPYLVYFTLKIIGQSLNYCWHNFISLLIIILLFWGTSNITSVLVKTSQITNVGMINPDPYNRLAVGLHLNSNGRYSEEVNQRMVILTNKHKLSRPQASWQITKENLQDLKKTSWKKRVEFVINKQSLYTFGTFDGLSFPLGYLYPHHPRLYQFLNWTNTIYILVIFFTAIIGTFSLMRQHSLVAVILPFIIFVGLFSNLFNEVQYRYSFSIQPLIFILGGIGINQIYNYLGQLLSTKFKSL